MLGLKHSGIEKGLGQKSYEKEEDFDDFESDNLFTISEADAKIYESAHCVPIDKQKRLLVGGYPEDKNHLQNLKNMGVSRIINLTCDKSYDDFAQKMGGITVISSILHRRNKTSPDSVVLAVCRKILSFYDLFAQEKVYIHSEWGTGRAAVVAIVLIGEMYHVKTNRAISIFEKMRKRIFPHTPVCAPMCPETQEQVYQIFRILGNPEMSSSPKNSSAFSQKEKDAAKNRDEPIEDKEYIDLPERGGGEWIQKMDVILSARKIKRKSLFQTVTSTIKDSSL